jgi:hypothetical protein
VLVQCSVHQSPSQTYQYDRTQDMFYRLELSETHYTRMDSELKEFRAMRVFGICQVVAVQVGTLLEQVVLVQCSVHQTPS